MSICERIILYFLLGVVVAMLFSGCSMSFGQKTRVEPVVTEPPTPGVQLWQAAKKSNWLVTISILGIAMGTFALVSGSVKLGTAAIASSSVSLFMALAVARFALWMGVFGLIGSVVAALFSILVRRKALVEIIKGVQKVKTGGLLDEYEKTALLGEEQSSTTVKIVGNIKNELKLKGEIR